MMIRPNGPGLIFLGLVILLGGCSGGKQGTVTGTVSYKGKPIPSGKIIFEVAKARPATGLIVDGKITEVTTYELNDGVPVGLAGIAVFALEEPAKPAASSPPPKNPGDYKSGPMDPGYMGMNAKSLIPKKYNHPATSGLTWQIKAGKNEVVLDLQD